MRRLSPRRLFLYLACGISGLVLFINIGHRGLLSSSLTDSTQNPIIQAEEKLSRRLAEDAVVQVPDSNTKEKDEVSVANLSIKNNDPANGSSLKDTGPTNDSPSLADGTSNQNLDADENIQPIENEKLEDHEQQIQPKKPGLALDRISPLDPTDKHIPTNEEKAWYMKEGKLRPKRGSSPLPVWPEELPNDDRIPNQLMYIPESVPENQENSETPLKEILLWNGASSWGGLKAGRGVFLKEECPVSSCVLVNSRERAASADLILFKDHFSPPTIHRPSSQVWMLYLLECPLHTQMFRHNNVFNWTATYRTDSTVVAPYERWQYFNENARVADQGYNYAENKTKKVAWFVSNCGARNGRLQYARELAKYIEVDIYGACGTKRCPRTEASKCFNMLNTDYKFYLAFENSNCKDYITEKFFVNGLGHDVLPIAMGARYEDYLRSAPHKSFIHVDQFKGPKELADYLHMLDKNDDKYNEYFQWKGTGEFVNTKFFCRVCAMLHDSQRRAEEHRTIADVNEWWRGKGTCVTGSWNKDQPLENKEEAGEVEDDE